MTDLRQVFCLVLCHFVLSVHSFGIEVSTGDAPFGLVDFESDRVTDYPVLSERNQVGGYAGTMTGAQASFGGSMSFGGRVTGYAKGGGGGKGGFGYNNKGKGKRILKCNKFCDSYTKSNYNAYEHPYGGGQSQYQPENYPTQAVYQQQHNQMTYQYQPQISNNYHQPGHGQPSGYQGHPNVYQQLSPAYQPQPPNYQGVNAGYQSQVAAYEHHQQQTRGYVQQAFSYQHQPSEYQPSSAAYLSEPSRNPPQLSGYQPQATIPWPQPLIYPQPRPQSGYEQSQSGPPVAGYQSPRYSGGGPPVTYRSMNMIP